MGLECAEKEEVNCKGKGEEGGMQIFINQRWREEERKLRKRNNLRPFKRNYRGEKRGRKVNKHPFPPKKT